MWPFGDFDEWSIDKPGVEVLFENEGYYCDVNIFVNSFLQ